MTPYQNQQGLSDRFHRAINLACRLHQNQVRKGDGGLPYITHPFAVAWILGRCGADEDTIIAGLLHDALEDVADYRYRDLERDFGQRVLSIVKQVSEEKDPANPGDKKASWESRKKKYLAGLEEDDEVALMVCAADKIHNLLSLTDAYRDQGEAVWKNFNATWEQMRWFNEEILKIMKERLQNDIIQEYEGVLKAFNHLQVKSMHASVE